MEEQKNENTNWLNEEAETMKESAFDEDRLPALKLEENKIADLVIDFTIPFDKWEDVDNNTTKKIIPVTFKGEKLVWWLNVKNPIYGQIIMKGVEGQTKFKVLQTGSAKSTKYTLVEEDESPVETASMQA